MTTLRRLTEGDLDARVVAPDLPEDLAELARALDGLAGALKARESDRARAAERLRRSDALFRELARSIDEVFWVTEPKPSPFVYVSPAYDRIWGRPAEDLYSNPGAWTASIHPEDRARVVQAAHEKEEHGRYEEVYRIVRPDGAVRWIRDRAFPVRGPDGRIQRIFGVAEDVTALKEAESALKQVEEELRHTQKMEAVGGLAGGVAHDFNNLLGVVLGNGELLLRSLPGDHAARRYAEEILAAVDRAATLTRQLLLFSRKQVLEPRSLDLNTVVTGIHRMLHRLLGEHIEIRLRLQAGLASVFADPGQMEQVLVNLAVNARDAMPEGGPLTIETADAELDEGHARLHDGVTPGRYVLLAVSDAGAGMDAAVRARIFDPFFTTKAIGKGTGLGLTTVYGIVQQSHGHIWVYSEVGHGTTFRIYLPFHAETAEERARIARVETEPPGGEETVLLVEDDAPLRDLARAVLEEAGYEVLGAADPESALQAAASRGSPVDLLITDVVLPGMNGPALAARLAEGQGAVRTLFVSGYAGDAIGALSPGAPFLAKPFTRRALLEKVRSLLDAAGAQPA